MVDFWTLMAFIPAGIALNLSPGADMMFCLGLGLRSGPRAAVAASAGISTGGMVHVTLAGLGLSAAVAAAPWALDAIRWLGIGYLLWLAWNALRAGPLTKVQARHLSPARAFLDGMVVNLLNPKVIFFILAFVPQFVDPTRGSVLGQFLIFGLVLAIGGLIINGGIGMCAGSLGQRFTHSARANRWLGWISAGVFTALAVRLALLERA